MLTAERFGKSVDVGHVVGVVRCFDVESLMKSRSQDVGGTGRVFSGLLVIQDFGVGHDSPYDGPRPMRCPLTDCERLREAVLQFLRLDGAVASEHAVETITTSLARGPDGA